MQVRAESRFYAVKDRQVKAAYLPGLIVNHSNPLIRYAPKPEPVIQDHNGQSNNKKVDQVVNVDEVEMGKR